MKQRTIYTENQPDVRYKKINEVRADVIVNKFVGEETMIVDAENETKQTMYVYETNILSVDPMKITENDIKNKLSYYLNYEEEKEKTLEEEVKILKEENAFLSQCLMEMSEIVYA